MRELKEDTFSENKNKDAHDHVDRVLNIESEESLYQAWECYNDLLYKRPTHDINSHQKVNIFYKGLNTINRQLLDSQGLIPEMTPTQALTEIQLWLTTLKNGTMGHQAKTLAAALILMDLLQSKISLGIDWYKENSHDNKPRPRDYTFREWMIVKALDPDKDPMERSVDDYKWVFDLEIEQLADEYNMELERRAILLIRYEKTLRISKVQADRRKLLRPTRPVIVWYVLWKPSQDFTRPLGPPSGLKGLLHMLNAIVVASDDLRDALSVLYLTSTRLRRISDNILLTQELMRNYHRNMGPPRCAFKVDIQKAYDTGKHGLRQGDPLSPNLFTLVMEVLTLILHRRVCLLDSFRFHKQCEELNIINLCFADDLFLFTRGDFDSAKVIMESLDEFKGVSGLVPSIPKSTAYFCNIFNHVKLNILSIMPFAEGDLLVKYLGVPLISSKLLNRDCKILVEKAWNRIGDWKNKSLSFTRRLQLCRYVISSMQVYWASVLVIPMGIVYDIQQLIRGFLWCNGDYKRGKAKVAWDDICLPKREGGLGLRSLKIHTYKLRGLTFWDIVPSREMSWGWWKLLQLRPLNRFLTPRDIAREGFTLQSCVADLIVNGTWKWPNAWLAKAPNLGMENVPPILDEIIDWFRHMTAKRTVKSIFGKLLFDATAYYIWSERNMWLFRNSRRSPEELKDLIMVVVRLKISTFRFKNRLDVIRMLSAWKLPKTFSFYVS
nr:hypothetical protein [Tanacetum cinerariifolium]